MKLALTILLLLFFLNAKSQLKIEDKSKQYNLASTADITNFISDNNFDYALICWYSSTWMRMYSNFDCLIKQGNNWYLAKIIRRKYNNAPAKLEPPFKIYQKSLNKAQVDSVWNKIDPAKAFKYSQSDFDKLPAPCVYKINGKESGFFDIQDAVTYHLIQFANKKVNSLYFYAPDYYLEKCSVHLPEFNILKGFIQATQQLSIATKIWKNNDN